MRSLDTIQKLSKIGRVLSKIAFIFSVIGVCGCIAGLLSLSFSGENLLKIGSVTLHGLFSDHLALSKSATAALAGWLIVCAGEAVVAKFAETKGNSRQEPPSPWPGRRNCCAWHPDHRHLRWLCCLGRHCRRRRRWFYEHRAGGSHGSVLRQ